MVCPPPFYFAFVSFLQLSVISFNNNFKFFLTQTPEVGPTSHRRLAWRASTVTDWAVVTATMTYRRWAW